MRLLVQKTAIPGTDPVEYRRLLVRCPDSTRLTTCPGTVQVECLDCAIVPEVYRITFTGIELYNCLQLWANESRSWTATNINGSYFIRRLYPSSCIWEGYNPAARITYRRYIESPNCAGPVHYSYTLEGSRIRVTLTGGVTIYYGETTGNPCFYKYRDQVYTTDDCLVPMPAEGEPQWDNGNVPPIDQCTECLFGGHARLFPVV